MRARIRGILLEAENIHKKLDLEVASFLEDAAKTCLAALALDGKIMLAGNGGSAADAQHIAAELVGRFKKDRAPIPAIALTTDTSILTAIGNDFGFDYIFSRQIQALAETGDVLILITTSGESLNILNAQYTAKQLGIDVILFDNKLIPSKNTARIQEVHILFGHILAEIIEDSI